MCGCGFLKEGGKGSELRACSDSSPSSGSCPCCDLRKPLWSLKTWSQEHLSWDFPYDSGAVWADGQATSLLRERFGYLETLLGKESEAGW